MKILIVIIRWKGGVGRSVNSVIRELEKRNHEVEVISREDDLKCFSTIQAFFKLRKEVKKRDYDILYIQDWSCAISLLFFKNLYVCFNGVESENSFFQILVGKIKSNKIISIGDQVKERFPKSKLIYVGVDRNLFKNLNLKREKNTVGFANFHNDSYNYENIKKATKELGLTFKDTNMKLSRDEMSIFFNEIETFISIPEPFAGFNMSWIEAMACGVPKIIGNYNGVGKQLDINHIEDFDSISDALKNAKIKKSYKINPEFNWEIHVNKLLEIFEK